MNLGCGSNPLKEDSKHVYTNIDMLKREDILQHDITKTPYPLAKDQFDLVYMFHCIEHIPEEQQPAILLEIRRLLKPKGIAVFSYPEFTKIAKNYISNYKGMRDFWKATIYGRGLTEWDRHKALMDTFYFCEVLKSCGLFPYKVHPERSERYNTVVYCTKVEVPITYEELLGKEFTIPQDATDS